MRRKGFAPIELLTVIAITVILAVILFPRLLPDARASADDRLPLQHEADQCLAHPLRSMSTATAGFYVTGGTLRPDTPSSIEREADLELIEACDG